MKKVEWKHKPRSAVEEEEPKPLLTNEDKEALRQLTVSHRERAKRRKRTKAAKASRRKQRKKK